MLTQLAQSGMLGRSSGFALGTFRNCEAKPGEPSSSLAQTLEEHLAPRQQPSMYGLSFGHISRQVTLPVGVRARLDTGARTLTLLENAVT
jgi:muramoyltetrapeptide carboxypeptidase